MALDVELLRSSFQLVVERDPELTLRFYAILLDRHPDLAPMFPVERRAQQARMLAAALTAVLEHLEDATWLGAQLGALGSRHVGYGVTEEMYGWVGDALLATLAEVAAEAWTPELVQAWGDAYAAIVSLMLRPTQAAAE
jgi:hemoglobin-like flavoprotein